MFKLVVEVTPIEITVNHVHAPRGGSPIEDLLGQFKESIVSDIGDLLKSQLGKFETAVDAAIDRGVVEHKLLTDEIASLKAQLAHDALTADERSAIQDTIARLEPKLAAMNVHDPATLPDEGTGTGGTETTTPPETPPAEPPIP